MDRRTFSKVGYGLGLGWMGGVGLWPAVTQAQGGPVEGAQYSRVPSPVATTAPSGKVEVIEFFWYGCPHCYALEASLEAWHKKMPQDVAFRRVPVAFRKVPFEAHQRIYFALESLGQLPALHSKVFTALHQLNQKLEQPDEISSFMANHGVDRVKFLDAYNSFAIQAKGRQAQQLIEAYRIEGVPTLAIAGTYLTSPSQAGGNEALWAVVDFLIARARKSA